MTDMREAVAQETLREAVARAVCPLVLATTEYYNEVPPEEVFSRPRYSFLKDACLFVADAAIATMFERLRTPSEGMIEAGSEAANDGHCSIDADAGPWVRSTGIEAGWQAMLTAFQQENSDAATDR